MFIINWFELFFQETSKIIKWHQSRLIVLLTLLCFVFTSNYIEMMPISFFPSLSNMLIICCIISQFVWSLLLGVFVLFFIKHLHSLFKQLSNVKTSRRKSPTQLYLGLSSPLLIYYFYRNMLEISILILYAIWNSYRIGYQQYLKILKFLLKWSIGHQKVNFVRHSRNI